MTVVEVSPVVAVQTAFRDRAQQIDGVQSALDYEPGQARIPLTPCVTMLWLGAEIAIEEVGAGTQTVRWAWDVFTYVNFSDSLRAQQQLQAIVPQLIKIVRNEPGLGGAERAWIEDALAVPELGPEDRWLRKRIRLLAQTVEKPDPGF